MIIRVFRPTIQPGKEREFEAFLRDTALPLVSQQSGLVAQHAGRPRDPSSTEYVYVTVWEDVEAIRAFAGERWQQAVITPDEQDLLRDTWIGHYELLPTPDCRSSPARPPQPAHLSDRDECPDVLVGADPTDHNPDTPASATPLVTGPTIRLPGHHAKGHRDGHVGRRRGGRPTVDT